MPYKPGTYQVLRARQLNDELMALDQRIFEHDRKGIELRQKRTKYARQYNELFLGLDPEPPPGVVALRRNEAA